MQIRVVRGEDVCSVKLDEQHSDSRVMRTSRRVGTHSLYLDVMGSAQPLTQGREHLAQPRRRSGERSGMEKIELFCGALHPLTQEMCLRREHMLSRPVWPFGQQKRSENCFQIASGKRSRVRIIGQQPHDMWWGGIDVDDWQFSAASFGHDLPGATYTLGILAVPYSDH